jgi:hypothetical protein
VIVWKYSGKQLFWSFNVQLAAILVLIEKKTTKYVLDTHQLAELA